MNDDGSDSDSNTSYYSVEEYDKIEDYLNHTDIIDSENEFFLYISSDGTRWLLPRYYKPEADEMLWTRKAYATSSPTK
tara:strand:+ start:1992 stop:2225 length:234 start_codon:yes stop_codon:yes gene_type:complete